MQKIYFIVTKEETEINHNFKNSLYGIKYNK